MREYSKTNGETDLAEILRSLKPQLNEGEFVFCNVSSLASVDIAKVIYLFREQEGFTVVLEKRFADVQQLPYTFVAAWITLTVHSSLEAVGLTAAFSAALAERGISCNVAAATFHDHIFVGVRHAEEAMQVLTRLAGKDQM